MTLDDWAQRGWLIAQTPNRHEIAELLEGAERDLHECQSPTLGPDWRLAIAHNCSLLAAAAALAAAGFRAERDAYHYRVLQSLSLTIGVDRTTLAKLDILRKKRNQSAYLRAGVTTSAQADEAVTLARAVLRDVRAWLARHDPDLVDTNHDP